jgi:anti-sigma-K factor RskA
VNVQEYISSGIVESYVLGLADASERAEFERLVNEHPEVRAAREAFEISLETYAQHNVLQPPAHIKSKILSSIEMESQQSAAGSGGGGSSVPPTTAGNLGGGSNEGRSTSRVMVVRKDFSRFLAAASVILLLMSTALNFYFFSRYKEYNEKYQSLIAEQTELASHNQILQSRLLEYERAVEMMNDPAMYVVKMPAIPTAPDPTSATTVYWDTRTKDVYLAVNRLPAPSADQQYQLWALVDGKPVDAGVFDLKEGAGMTKMKNIPRAQAFAITLEKKGGSPAPTMTMMYVMGKV